VEKRGEKDYFSFEHTGFKSRLNETLSFLFLKIKAFLVKDLGMKINYLSQPIKIYQEGLNYKLLKSKRAYLVISYLLLLLSFLPFLQLELSSIPLLGEGV